MMVSPDHKEILGELVLEGFTSLSVISEILTDYKAPARSSEELFEV